MTSFISFKPEFGNRQHIQLVCNYDERMRGVKPVMHRLSLAGCEPEQLDDRDGTWEFHRVPGLTRKFMHAVVVCPQCLTEAELCFCVGVYYLRYGNISDTCNN